MSKHKLQKSDYYRILLTETLPYEVPIVFSNDEYYKYLKQKKTNAPLLIKEILSMKCFTIPYNYHIKKSLLKDRTLSIIHPSTQIKFVDFYKENSELLINLCSRSSFSLRYPSKVVSHYFKKEHKDDEVGKKEKYASSYFVYSKYNFLYKFYDSYEFHQLEKKYSYLLKFDISNCFYSIYTHTISWAIKGKQYAKNTINYSSIEKEFDRLMQESNYNETNGIVVGPEVSRIFAEIILQKIDINVQKSLEKKDIVTDKDVVIRRYIDDFFIFTNELDIANIIMKEYQEHLEEYKLYINQNKIEKQRIPFISSISIAKIAFNNYFTELFRILNEKKKYSNNSHYNIANTAIMSLKCIIKQHSIEYDNVSNYVFSIINRKVKSLTKSSKSEEDVLYKNIYIILDISFFIYSMDVRVRTTYQICKLILEICNLSKAMIDDYAYSINKKIIDESIQIIKKTSVGNKEYYIESMNLLVIMKKLSSKNKIDKEVVEDLFLIKKENVQQLRTNSYFFLMTLLFFIGNNKNYSSIKNIIELEIVKRMKSVDSPWLYSELVMLFFDSIKCPYINTNIKDEIITVMYKKTNTTPTPNDIVTIKKFLMSRTWFFNWKGDAILEELLERKELSTVY